MRKIILVIISAMIIILSAGCGENSDEAVHNNETDTTASVTAKTDAEVKELDIHTVKNPENELVFGFSAESFIECYNDCYSRQQGRDYFTPLKEWRSETLEKSIHSEHETVLYTFSEEPERWSLPTVWVFAVPESGLVREITLNFDWHSYSDDLYELYGEMCFYTLKVMFPDMSEYEIREFYTKVNDMGYNDPFPAEKRYGVGSVPHVLFYRDGIGIYPYFALGSDQKLCIIPVTEEAVNELGQKGVQIYEIGE